MRKKIRVEKVRLGMYIHELCGSWMDHPFWRKSFLLDKDADLNTLRSCGIQEVWIDPARGLDAEDDTVAVSDEEAERQITAELALIAKTKPQIEARVSLHDELERARKFRPRARLRSLPCSRKPAWARRSK